MGVGSGRSLRLSPWNRHTVDGGDVGAESWTPLATVGFCGSCGRRGWLPWHGSGSCVGAIGDRCRAGGW